MKKITLILAAFALACGVCSAQDMKKATELAQSANDALVSEDYETALAGFREALAEAEQCEDGENLVQTCKDVIPTILYSIGNQKIKDGDTDAAIEVFKEAVQLAKEYGNIEIEERAGSQIITVFMKKGGDALNSKDFAAAAEAYGKVIENQPENGVAYIRLGLSKQGLGLFEEAEAAFLKAAEFGQAPEAEKRLKGLAITKVSKAYTAKDYDTTIALADEYIQKFGDDQKAYQFLLFSTLNTKKLADAEKYLKAFTAAFPDAKNAGEYAFRIAVEYQKANKLDKAREYYKLAFDDPKYGKTAKETYTALGGR